MRQICSLLMVAFPTLLKRSFFTAGYKPVVVADELKNRIEISPPPGTPVKASVIFLHGLGDTAYGWGDACYFISKKFEGLRFVLPTAKSQPVTLNMGYVMPSWYDIKALNNKEEDSCDGIEDSRLIVLDILTEEVNKGIPHEKIVIGGSSQGGALSLWSGLQLDKKIGGVLCMSGYLPNAKNFKLNDNAKDIPVGIFHGINDPVVKLWMAEKSHKLITDLGCSQVSFNKYPGLEHSASNEEIEDVIKWLEQIVR